MEFKELSIQGVWLATSPVHSDSRGDFREWFKQAEALKATGLNFEVAQANISISAKNVLRGIHFSTSPVGQAKWVTCAAGLLTDVVVDLRQSSPTYKKWLAVDLDSRAGESLLISAGLGHAFVAKEDDTVIAYLLNSPYSPTDEYTITPFDEEIGIEWELPHDKYVLSERDQEAPTLSMHTI